MYFRMQEFEMPTVDPFVRDPFLTSSPHRPKVFRPLTPSLFPASQDKYSTQSSCTSCVYIDRQEGEKKSLVVQTLNIKASQTENTHKAPWSTGEKEQHKRDNCRGKQHRGWLQ